MLFMKKIFLLTLACFTVYLASAQQDLRLKDLETELNKILEVTKAPGFAVAIVEGKKVLYAKGFGYRDFEKKIPADENTLYAIGSCSKAFTCAILGQLRNDGKLSFDDHPSKYIADLEFYNDEMNSSINIQDIMCHRTGLPRHDYSWYLFPTFDKDSLIMRIKYQEPFTGVRQKWYYNNFMFLTQGVIAENITGKSWEDNIRERFFQPLNMKRSNVSIDEMKKSANAALGYELKHDSIISQMDYYHIAAMSPAGSINSSVSEMANWVITWINKGKFDGKEILPEAYVSEAMSSQMTINAGLPDPENPDMHLANYGYGWFISSYRGHYRVDHGGNIDGFSASTAFFPTDSLGIVVLTNQNGSSVPSLVRNTVADRMLKTKTTDWAEFFKTRQEETKKEQAEGKQIKKSVKIDNTKPSHILQEYTGKYSNPGYGTFDISIKGDSLFAHFKLKKYYLHHVHYDVFEPLEVTASGIEISEESNQIRFNFSSNNSGEITLAHLNIEPGLDHPIEFKHAPNIIHVDKATLEKYVGEYNLPGVKVKVYIKNEKILYFFVPGQPEYELLPTGEHKFAFKALEGFKLEFFEAPDKSIKELDLIQPNGTFKATRE